MKKLLLILTTIALFSCGGKTTPNPTASITNYITDTLFSNKSIVNIKLTDLDSTYFDVSEHPAFKSTFDHLIGYSSKLDHEISDYHYERALGGTGINKGLIELYQKNIREDFTRLEELKKSYKPKFKGFTCYAQIRYKTDFNDSIAIAVCCLSPQKDKIIDYYIIPTPLDMNTDSLISVVKAYNSEGFVNPIDTTNFIRF